jgi:hypothetical protein
MSLRRVALALLGLTNASFAHAEGPAVSAINGKFSLEGGAIGGGGTSSSATGTAQGSITTPLGSSFGLQVDGVASLADNSFLGGGAAHLFWRDPQVGLVGPIVALAGDRGATIGWYGGEGELYAGAFTLGALAGYQSASSPFNLVQSGGFYQGTLTAYPTADLALTVGGGQVAGIVAGLARVEFQPAFIDRHDVSFFVDSSVGEDGFYRVTGGVRFYFGPEKSLIRRHREDDPPAVTVYNAAGAEVAQFFAFDSSYRGGVFVGDH